LALVPGVVLDTKYGVKLKINRKHVKVDYGNKSFSIEQYTEIRELASGLNRFIRYTNNQSGRAHLSDKVADELLSIFKNNGIDTNKSFVINSTEFNTTEHDMIEKSGVNDIGFTGLPDYLVRKQFDAYGEQWGIDFDWED
jgi:hypothetical protein